MRYTKSMNKGPLLIVFLGFPGSGKTYFATRLAERIHAVTINSDALRVSMFGSLDEVDRIRKTDVSRLYRDVFGAMDYATMQILRAGHSVVYDAQQTKRENRRNIERTAQEAGAIPLLVWVKTSPSVALVRGQERDASDDSHQYTAEKMTFLIERFESVTDMPDESENVIEISGEVAFDEQYAVFERKLEEIRRG